MTDYSGAPCVGRWTLFEPTDIEDVEGNLVGYNYPHESEAKALCAVCPFIRTCLAENRNSDMIVGGTTPTERRRKK